MSIQYIFADKNESLCALYGRVDQFLLRVRNSKNRSKHFENPKNGGGVDAATENQNKPIV